MCTHTCRPEVGDDRDPEGSAITVSDGTGGRLSASARADNDPIVLAHARALMTSHPTGATAFIQADLRDPGRILAAFFTGLDLVDPGVTPVLGWRPDDAALEDPRGAYFYAAMVRKP